MTENFQSDNPTMTSSIVRQKRHPVTFEVLKRVRKHLEKNSSTKCIANDIEMSASATYKLINKITSGLIDEDILSSKKGRPKQEFPEIKNKISQILNKDSSFTQLELSHDLMQFGIRKSQSTVCRTLKDMEYTRKRLVKIPQERNTPKNIDARQNYAREMQFISNDNLVFLDETGLNLHQTRNYGYSPKNAKAYKVVKGGRGKNISCLLAIKKRE